MATTSITLTDPGSGISVPIAPVSGVSAKSLEVEPVPRVVVEDRVSGDGSVDTTQFLSEAVVTLNLVLYGGGQAAFMDSLNVLLHPGKRPYLIVTASEWPQTEGRQLTVRMDSMLKPRSDRTNWPVQIIWQAPSGVWEDASTTELDVPVTLPSTTGIIVTATTGLHISSTGLHMPPTSAPGEFSVTNPGTVASQWTASLYGPAVGPKLANDTTGLTIEFTDDISLQAGDYIALDSGARSATLNGDPNSSVLSNISFDTTDWWQIVPGVNTLRYYPSSGQPGAEAVVVYRPSWLP